MGSLLNGTRHIDFFLLTSPGESLCAICLPQPHERGARIHHQDHCTRKYAPTVLVCLVCLIHICSLIYLSLPVCARSPWRNSAETLHSWKLCTASFTHKNICLNMKLTKTLILYFYIILCPPSQNDILAVGGN